MLEIIKSDKFEFLDDIRIRYPGCKVLISLISLSDFQDRGGRLYAVSHSHDSLKALCDLCAELKKDGLIPMVVGRYKHS